MPSNDERLKAILDNVLLIDDHEYRSNFGPDEIEAWDSLATISIVSAVKKEFGVEIDPEEMADWSTIGDIKESLRRKGVSFR